MNRNRKILIILFLLLFILIIGVIGYSYLLNIRFLDAFYMTVITLSTVGYGEVRPMTAPAKVFTILLIFSGLSVFGYALTNLVAFFFEGNLKTAWRKRKMETRILELNEHYILCGAGDVGRSVIKSFMESRQSFVVIEENEKNVEVLQEQGILTISGNAAHEEILEKAGITKAKGIVCCLPTDVENVFIVLTARQMNPDIYIVSKAVEASTHNKLKKAGADKTISPNEIGGQRIASLLIRPTVVSFLDVITRTGDVTLDLEEVPLPSNSALLGKRLSEARIPELTGLIVIALKKQETSNFIFNPGSYEVLNSGDTMIVLGTNEQILKLKSLVS